MSETLVMDGIEATQTGGEPCLMGKNNGGTRFVSAAEAITASRTHGKAVISVKKGGGRMSGSSNRLKLLWLVQTFGIKPADAARLVGYSRAYFSRVTSGDASIGSDEFFNALERNLDKLIALRTRSLFQTESVPVDQLQDFGNQLKKCA